MQPATFQIVKTFNELYPVWEQDIAERDWTPHLRESLRINKAAGGTGTVAEYIDSLFSRLYTLPMAVIRGYDDYLETIKSFKEKAGLTSDEAYLVLMFSYKLSLDMMRA